MKQVGYLVWHKNNANDKDFTTQPLTNADRSAGFIEQKVYIDETEQPA